MDAPESPSPESLTSELLTPELLTDAGVVAFELRAIVRALKRRLREQTQVGDLTPSQSAVIARLEQDGAATASALARAEGMRAQSMGPIIAALESAGMIMGEPDPADGRQKLLSLTEACRERIRRGREARQDWLTRTIATQFTPAEQAALLQATALLRRIVES